MPKSKKHSSSNHITGSITSEDVLGKDVIDPNGEYIGISDKLLLDPITLKVLGISVDKGFLRKGLIIGTSYIGEITPHAVLLNKQLHVRIKGMTVYSSTGERLGSISEYATDDEGTLTQISIKTRMFSDDLELYAKYVESIENSVILNIPKSEVLTMNH